MLHFILFGPPGSGKGTQALKLVEKYHLAHISTGDLFRAETTNKTELGLRALEFMNLGKLVPDEITIAMLKNKLSSLTEVNGVIYDGFPRTTVQAEALDQMLEQNGECITGLVALEVSDDEVVRRILKRGLTSGRADDNDENIIRKRMEEYRNKTAEVYNFYTKSNKSYSVNGLGSVEDIFHDLSQLFDKFQSL